MTTMGLLSLGQKNMHVSNITLILLCVFFYRHMRILMVSH